MRDLRLIGVHEDGARLLLAGGGDAADDAQFTVVIDDRLRAAVGVERPQGGLSELRQPVQVGRQGHLPVEVDRGLRPRDIQALIRAGASTEDAAEQSGWSVEKVGRYEVPIIAERENVARLAQAVPVRGRQAIGGSSSQTLESRVVTRLADRGVTPEGARWDSSRGASGPWTVVLTFPAGGREREATWHFDPVDRTIVALDDEARWLSEDEQQPGGGLISTQRPTSPRRRTRVYDVEAEGGLRATQRPDDATHPTWPGVASADQHDEHESSPDEPSDHASGEHGHHDRPVDLVTAMRERSAVRGRRRSGSRRASRKSPTHVPGSEDVPDDALPLEHLHYDPETMTLPPAAHPHPDESGPGVDAEATPTSEATQQAPPGEADQQSDPSTPSPPDGDADEPAGASADATTPAARPGRKRGRPSVPSWDDVMFGASPHADR